MIYVVILAVWVATVLGGFAYGHHDGDKEGFARGHAEYTNLLSSYQQAAAKQAAATATVTTKQQEVTTNATNDYQKQLAALRVKYAASIRLRVATANSSGGSYVPPVPIPATGPDAASEKPVAVADCAQDALTLTALQHWIILQQQANP
jgi:hypothetical protein